MLQTLNLELITPVSSPYLCPLQIFSYMKFDRNTVIGFVLLALLFFGFFYFNNQEQARVAKNKAIQDSIAKAALPKPKADTLNKKTDTSHFNTPQISSVTGQFQKAMIGTEQVATVENDLVKITFTNKGGQIKSVELKKFKNQEKNLVKLASTSFDKIDYKIKGDPDQVGNIFSGRSMVIDPFGITLLDMGAKEGLEIIEIDRNRIKSVRKSLPLLTNRRIDAYHDFDNLLA